MWIAIIVLLGLVLYARHLSPIFVASEGLGNSTRSILPLDTKFIISLNAEIPVGWKEVPTLLGFHPLRIWKYSVFGNIGVKVHLNPDLAKRGLRIHDYNNDVDTELNVWIANHNSYPIRIRSDEYFIEVEFYRKTTAYLTRSY